MAIHKSTIKRHRQSVRKNKNNTSAKSNIKTIIAKACDAEGKDRDSQFREAVSVIDRAATKGLIHKNTASRRKSRLHKKMFKAGSEA